MKNTRLLYTDEAHIKMYEAMPCEQFKEFMLTVLKYKYGDDSILDTIQDPMVRALFMAEKQHIDYNEKKWADKAKIARENGSKSKGRPKKAEEPLLTASNGTPLPPPPQVTAVFYPPVPEDEVKDFPTQEDKEKWYVTLIPDGHPNRKDKFNKEWSYYFTSRREAAKEVEAFLAKNKIHISLM